MHKTTRLDNGLRVVTAELPHTRSATVSVYVGAGSRYERNEEAGLSH
ncbi:MAG: insulinase family protein, partial [Tepidiformaceae bacterium]